MEAGKYPWRCRREPVPPLLPSANRPHATPEPLTEPGLRLSQQAAHPPNILPGCGYSRDLATATTSSVSSAPAAPAAACFVIAFAACLIRRRRK